MMNALEAKNRGNSKNILLPEDEDGAYFDNGGVLRWNGSGVPVPLEMALRDIWQPYIEKEKCVACRDAQVLEDRAKSLENTILTSRDQINAAHLRKYHCECGE